jgi:myosin heavy subunit
LGGNGTVFLMILCDSCILFPRTQVERLKIEKKVLDCNPFLEAFGNAKTVRNDNSSRFGKFLKIEYDGGRIIGARMRHYLLEKARVIGPHKDERNYHIFYQFLAGASPEEKSMYKLGSATDYAYLISGGVTSVESVDDRGDFSTVREALLSVGVSEQLQQDMWRVLAAILHLGNIRFADGPGGECSVILNADVTEIAAEYLGTPTLASKLVRDSRLVVFLWKCSVAFA